ncbi:hypothetical protein GCM10011531_26800 [Aquaticitalea lipolytica]|uniref:Uncharacterized protein n=1 Tax=Aquaticitalea lipolytica TaxID=1247562 RepID=A0A8J2TUA9_9FLAO|nr:hypothetical protein [Aquaticitalea lipolytica]GFZ93403.1 hypothetical protein GCM10011531_26800 [Aquaticitalea lipolytica]
MKNLKLLFAFMLLFFVFTTINAQDFQVPKNYTLKVADDYKKLEKDVVDCVNWLENTPINKDENKRTDANAFFMQWITGSPDVSVAISSYVLDLTEKNPTLLITFMGAWTRYAIENPEDQDSFNGNFAGLKSIIKVYTNNKDSGIKKDKNVEKLLKLETDDDLKAWLTKNLKN